MRVWGLYALALVFAAFYGVTHAQAQDEYSPIQTWPEQTIVIAPSDDGSLGIGLDTLVQTYNICPETLYEANYTLFKADHRFVEANPIAPQAWLLYAEANTSIVIPAHEACYENFVFENEQYNAILDLEQTLNVCWEEFIDRISAVDNEDYTVRVWHVSVPQTAQPCYNDQNQRLTYYSEAGRPLLTPYYSTRQWVRFTDKEFADVPYCRGDLVRLNPGLSSYYHYYRPGMTVFIDDSVRLCETIEMSFTSFFPWIDGVSLEENVCLDVLIEANMPSFASTDPRRYDTTADIPYDAPPCYDQYGRRLGRRDRSVYHPYRRETLKEIAQKHNLCVQDLLDNNLHVYVTGIKQHYNPVAPIVFIPQKTPCDAGEVYRTRGYETLYDVSLLYNVCINYIQASNPAVADLAPNDLLSAEIMLKIPNRQPCWMGASYPTADGHGFYYAMIPYACYREPIDFNKDYTGTEPPLSLERDTNTDYCYDARENPILYENKFYDPIWSISSFDTLYDIAACYDIDFEEFVNLNELDIVKRIKFETSVFIPHEHETCDGDRWRALNARRGRLDNAGVYMVNVGDTLSSIGRQFGYDPSRIAIENKLDAPYIIYPYQELQMPPRVYDRRGYLDDKGVYVVAYGDTLASIGRRFGYLPSMIAAENNLKAPYVIYSYQELQMPRMPSLYDIGKSVLYAGGVGVGIIGFGLYRMRRRGKKKQKPAA